jgi:putative drug exporter of the RND superfamily
MINSMKTTRGLTLTLYATFSATIRSSLRILAQMGSTISIGLLLDTPIVRTLLMPSIATLLGRWFWWPQVIYPHGDRNPPRVQQSTDDTATTQPLRVGATSY